MSKWNEFKEKLKTPPPERLAAIEYKSHFLNILGVVFASVFLIYYGFWYLVFAFIFSVGVSYSQGMSALSKYKMIMEYTAPAQVQDIDLDPSPTRRRTKINQFIFGKKVGWVAAAMAVLASYLILNPIGAVWYKKVAFVFMLFFFYGIIFFYLFYWVAYPIYKRQLKGGVK